MIFIVTFFSLHEIEKTISDFEFSRKFCLIMMRLLWWIKEPKKNTDLKGENFWKWDWFFIRNYLNHISVFKSQIYIFKINTKKKNICSFISNNICQNSTARYCKGQLISKAIFKVFIWTKKPTKIFLPYLQKPLKEWSIQKIKALKD